MAFGPGLTLYLALLRVRRCLSPAGVPGQTESMALRAPNGVVENHDPHRAHHRHCCTPEKVFEELTDSHRLDRWSTITASHE